MVVVKDQLDPDLRKLIKKKRVAVIPVGSIEQHGPHLPVSTDSDIVAEIALRIAKRGNFLLLPTIFYGVSFEHSPFFNLSVKSSTLQKLLFELCLSLSSNGIKTIFVINGHYTNQKAINSLTSKINKISKGKIHVFVFSYWDFMKESFDHAGFVETSLMLAISNKVKMKLAKKGLTTNNLKSNEISKVKKIASKSFPKATKNGVWGDPRKASKKVGIELLSEIVRNLEKKCQTCLTGKNPKLHQ
ncbi:MAG TPA: creatininase family protein [Nitrosopumilaceae archaeon]|nr:creatininase family protein [Nitrosopumilaceae archaeon]